MGRRRARRRDRRAARNPGVPSRSTSTASMSRSACRAHVSVLPNHHLMSVTVAGPNARSQRAHQFGAGLLWRFGLRQRGQPLRPSASSADAISSTRRRWALGRCRRAPITQSKPLAPKVSRRPTVYPAHSRSGPPARAAPRAALSRWPRRVRRGAATPPRTPCPATVAVVGDPRLLRVRHQPTAFVIGHPVARARLDQRQVLGPHRPQRAAHREVLDQRAALVELGVQIGDGEAGQPRPQRQIRRGRVGRVQRDQLAVTTPSIESADPARKCRRASRARRSSTVNDRIACEPYLPPTDKVWDR